MSRVAVLGASDKETRTSNQAVKLLKEHDHEVLPVHPALEELEGLKVYASLRDIPEPTDTLTVYVSSDISTDIQQAIWDHNPKRIIFNPGSENPALMEKAQKKGIECLEACTLVLLKSNQF